MASMAIRSFDPSKINKKKDPSTDPKNAYNAAVLTQGADYDRLMKEYERLRQTNPILANYNYYQSPEERELIRDLRTDASTGGFSSRDRNAIRERGLSPVRSVYANAMRNAARSVNLSGGYSPNAGAVQSKLAREQSDVVSNAATNVNATLAEMVAQGKREARSMLAPLVSRESAYRAGIDANNLEEQRRIQTQLPLQVLQGQSSLYGTTPALASLFGQQALNLRQQEMQEEQMFPLRRRNSSSTAFNKRYS